MHSSAGSCDAWLLLKNALLFPDRGCQSGDNSTASVTVLCDWIGPILLFLILLGCRWDAARQQHLLKELIPAGTHWHGAP